MTKADLISKLNNTKLSSRQEKILKYLDKFNPRASKIYLGSVIVLQNKDNPDRIAQAAHSIRELDNTLMSDLPNKKPFGQKDAHIENINTFMKIQDPKGGLPKDIGLLIAKQWVSTHEEITNISHHVSEVTEKQLGQVVQQYEDILLSQIGPFYSTIEEIDKLLSVKNPTTRHMEQLKVLIKKGSHLDYIFHTNRNPNWLKLFVKEGFLKSPPQKIIHKDGSFSYPIWTAQEYLMSVAEKKPKEVMDIIINAEKSDSAWVNRSYLLTILKIPANVSKAIIKKLKKEAWLHDNSRFGFGEEIGKVIEKFVSEKEIDSAFELAECALSVREDKAKTERRMKIAGLSDPEVVPFLDEWEYGQLVQNKIPILATVDAKRTVALLADKLRASIKIRTGGKGGYKYDGFLSIWRPAVEDHEQNRSLENLNNILISGLRDVIESIPESKSILLKECVSSLSNSSGTYSIMKRLQLHMYRKFPKIFIDDITDSLKDPNNVYNGELKHEYFLLLGSEFSKLSKENQEAIIALIRRGPKMKQPNERYKKMWQAEISHKIKEYLPKDLLDIHAELEEKIEKDYDISSPITSWVGPTSHVDASFFDTKTAQEVLEYLNTWTPPTGEYVPSPEGLGRILQEDVKKRPSEYIKCFTFIVKNKLNPVYLYHILTGIRDVWRLEDPIWENILEVIEFATAKEIPYEHKYTDEGVAGDWKSVRKASADVLDNALRENGKLMPFKFRDRVWKIIEKLVGDSDPTPEHEEKYVDDDRDFLILSINTVRGEGLHALFKYAMWVSSNLHTKEEKKTTLPHEVKSLLEKILSKKVDGSHTTLAVTGQFYPVLLYLDETWTQGIKALIFPEPFESSAAQAAWNAYVLAAQYWTKSVESLMPEYRKAVLIKETENKRGNYKDRLAEHIVLAYLLGNMKIDDPALTGFFNNASDVTRAHAIWYVSRYLEEQKPKEKSQEWKRIKGLWAKRLKEAKNEDSQSELSHLALLLNHAPETIDDLYTMVEPIIPNLVRSNVIDDFLEYLVKSIPINLEKTLSLLLPLIKANPPELGYGIFTDEISQILEAGLRSSSDTCKVLAEEIINIFGERGNDGYRHLLKKN